MATISEYARARPRNEDDSFRTGGGKLYDWLLEFESVRSWINAYTAPLTRRNYLLGLNTLCKQLNLNPDQIIELARQNGDKVPHDLKTRFKDVTVPAAVAVTFVITSLDTAVNQNFTGSASTDFHL